jgi:hypothetical protein
MRKKLNPEQLEKLAGLLFRISDPEPVQLSPDRIFVAAIRERLRRQGDSPDENRTIGETCWKAAPFMAAICLILVLFLGLVADTSSSEVSASDRVWDAWASTSGSELSGQEIVGVILVERGGEE